MWYAASSQNNTAVYLLFFTLTAVFLVSIPHTLINLAGVTVTVESVQPAFVGQEVSLPLEIMNDSRATRHGIELILSGSDGEHQRIDHIPARKAARVVLRFPARQRGEHHVETLCLTSAYPLGFLRFLKKFAPSQTYIVYPKPEGEVRLPSSVVHRRDGRPLTEPGEGDDFAGVRDYVPGESQRHIDWRAVARGQPLMTKQFAAEAEGVVYFDLAASCIAFHIASHVRFSCELGAVCFSARARNEILAGAKRLSAAPCNAEVDTGGDGTLRHLRQLWIAEGR